MARSYDSENSDSDDGSDHGSEHEEPISKDYVVPNDFQLNLPLLVYLRKLGELSFERYKAADNLDDLKMCIHAMRDASYLILDENPDKPAVLVLFAKALRTRFERLTFSPDLDEAILSLTQAVDLTSNETPEKPSRLLALISALHARFKMTMDLADLGAAVKHGTKVLELTPDDHADRRIRLNSLAVSLQARFERLGKLADLQEAIRLKTIAVDIIPEIHPEKPVQLSNLAISLYLRHLHLKTLPDLVETIALQSRAIESTPDGHPDRTIMLRSLGRFYRTRLTSPYSQDDDLSNARGAFVRAMKEKSGHPDWRLRAGLDYIDLLRDSPSTPPLKSALLQAYDQILGLVPPMIWRNGDMRRREEEPVDLITLANKAAADAIAVGDNVKALEWIESGRVLVWGQVLQTKTPLDTLQEQHPQLASDFHRVYRELLAVSTPIDPFLQDENQTCESLEAQAERSRELATQYDALVSKIRELEGFENFLRYKKLEQLSGACTSGPVVIINVHHSRCDALVLHHPGEVVHVPLPTFSYDHAMKLRRQLSSVLETSQASGSRFRNGTISKEERLGSVAGSRFGRVTRDPMRVILADLWTQVVKPIFDAVCKLPSSAVGDGLPRITWCPTGPLVSLPLHAAGLYSEGTQLSPSIMDLAVSSYTPTLEALIKPRTFALPPKSPNPQPKILVVSQSDTPGYPPIEGAEIEAAIVASIFRKSTDIVEGSAGTVDAVLGAMKTHDWVHFACHSVQDSEHPTGSSFALHDGKLTLSKLMSLSVPHAELAVISTCQAPAANYVDGAHMGTAAHIAVGILQVGYGGVIGSMWPICDDSAPTVASRLYGTMYQQLTRGEFEPARALHEATRALRDEVGVENFTRWASFVHFGS